MISKKKLINDFLEYEKKYDYDNYKKIYKNDKDFIRDIKRLIEEMPAYLIDYILSIMLKPICYFEKMDENTRDKMIALINLLIESSLYLRENNKTMQNYYNDGRITPNTYYLH